MTDERTDQKPVGIVAGLSFCCELAMLVLLAVGGWALGSGTAARLLLAVALPAVAIAIWAVWMAPTSSRRLGDPARLLAQVALFVVVGAVLVWSGHPGWGVGFAVVASSIFALTRRVA